MAFTRHRFYPGHMASEPPTEPAEMRECLILSVHVEVGGLAAALGEAGKLVAALASETGVVTCKVDRYWKFPDQYRIVLDLGGEDRIARFGILYDLLAPAWSVRDEIENEIYAIWDARTDGEFILPSARWAHLNTFTRPVD